MNPDSRGIFIALAIIIVMFAAGSLSLMNEGRFQGTVVDWNLVAAFAIESQNSNQIFICPEMIAVQKSRPLSSPESTAPISSVPSNIPEVGATIPATL